MNRFPFNSNLFDDSAQSNAQVRAASFLEKSTTTAEAQIDADSIVEDVGGILRFQCGGSNQFYDDAWTSPGSKNEMPQLLDELFEARKKCLKCHDDYRKSAKKYRMYKRRGGRKILEMFKNQRDMKEEALIGSKHKIAILEHRVEQTKRAMELTVAETVEIDDLEHTAVVSPAHSWMVE